MKYRPLILILLFAAVFSVSAPAQDESDRVETEKAMERISGFIEELTRIASSINRSTSDDIKALEQNIKSVDVRWSTFYDADQLVIANDERLMYSMSLYQEFYVAVNDSIASHKTKLVAFSSFNEAEKVIAEIETQYSSLEDKAFKLSLTKQTAAPLAKLKVIEQMNFSKVLENMQKAQEATALNPSLEPRMAVLEDKVVNLQLKSEKIQAMEFKPILTRIKDSLLSLAAIAMILMFISTVKSKITAAKAAKENAKQYLEKIKNDDYPTI